MKEHYCEICNSFQEVTVKILEKKFAIKSKTVNLNAEVAICNRCENEVYDSELSQKLTENAIEEYNNIYGVSSSKINELLKYYSISSETLAKIIGCAKKTIFSYEKNLSVPSDTHMTVLKFVTNDFENLKDLAKINEIKLTKREKKKVLGKEYELDEIVFPYSNEYNGYVDFEEEKFINVILAFIDKGLGKTKLAKALFVLDFNSYDQYAKSITGLTYAKLPRGPMPEKFNRILEYLVDNKIIEMNTLFDGDYKKIEIKAMREVNYAVFDNKELELIQKAKVYISDKSAKELSEISHEGIIWNSTDDRKFISYDKVKDLRMKI